MRKLFKTGLNWFTEIVATKEEVASAADQTLMEPVIEPIAKPITEPTTMSAAHSIAGSNMEPDLKSASVPQDLASAIDMKIEEALESAMSLDIEIFEAIEAIESVEAPAESVAEEPLLEESVPSLLALAADPAPVVVVEELVVEPRAITSISKRGPLHYGVCPHCECTWNISERILAQQATPLSRMRTPACPSCRNPVVLPTFEDLKKLG